MNDKLCDFCDNKAIITIDGDKHCKECCAKCEVDNQFYSADDVIKCEICGYNKHTSYYDNSTRSCICNECDEELEKEYQEDLSYMKQNSYDRY